MYQLVRSPQASSLYSICVLLARTTCTADDKAFAIFERLGPLLDLGSPCRHELSHRCYSLCSLKTPRALTRPGFPGRHELSHRCYSLCSLQTLRALTRPGFPGRHELSSGYYSLYSFRMPRALTRPGFPGRHELSRRCYNLCGDDSTNDVPSSTVFRPVASPISFEDVAPKVPGACAAPKRRLLTYKRMRLHISVWQ